MGGDLVGICAGLLLPNFLPQSGFQRFPFYAYAEDSSNRRENITDWALEQFRARYHDSSIGKWDIFHYIYAVLHDPGYRERYAANLRRELPRIPFVSAVNCHPEAAESLAKPRTPNEGLVHSGGGVARASRMDLRPTKNVGLRMTALGMTALGRVLAWGLMSASFAPL